MQACPNCPDHVYKILTTSKTSSSLTSIPKHTSYCIWVCRLPRKLTQCENKHGTCSLPVWCVHARSLLGPLLAGSAVPRLPLKTSGRADFPAPLALFAWLLLCLFPGWISISIMSTPPSSTPAILLLFPTPPPSSIIPCWL